MSFTEDIQTRLVDYRQQYQSIEDTYLKHEKDLRNKLRNESITRSAFDNLMQDPRTEYESNKKDLYESARGQIMQDVQAYVHSLEDRYLMTPNMLDDADLAMLSSDVVNLTAQDLDALAKKHADNMPMMKVICDYELEHQTGAEIHYYSQQQRVDEANDYARGAIRALEDPMTIRFAMYETGSALPPALAGE